jgi:hypothetical protein
MTIRSEVIQGPKPTFYEAPGVALFPLGYVTFGGNGGGDVYCMDTSVTTAKDYISLLSSRSKLSTMTRTFRK